MGKHNSDCIKLIKPHKSEIKDIVYDFTLSYDLPNETICIIADKYAKYAEFIAAYYNQEIAGYIAYYRNDFSSRIAYITMIVVKERYKKKGIATLMLKYVINDCAKNSFNTIRLEVNNENKSAISLYEKFGFKFEKSAGEQSSYYKLIIKSESNKSRKN